MRSARVRAAGGVVLDLPVLIVGLLALVLVAVVALAVGLAVAVLVGPVYAVVRLVEPRDRSRRLMKRQLEEIRNLPEVWTR